MGFQREFNWWIVTKEDQQVRGHVNSKDYFTITKEGYREYPMDIPIYWKHKGEEQGMFAVVQLLWAESKTTIIIARVGE